MTRFARAKGSKASNERLPEEATSWEEMKKQLLEKNKEIEENAKRKEAINQRNANYKAFLEEKERSEKGKTSWADFPAVTKSQKPGKERKIKLKSSVTNKLKVRQNRNGKKHSSADQEFSERKATADKLLDNNNFNEVNNNASHNDAPEEKSTKKEVIEPVVNTKKHKQKKLKIISQDKPTKATNGEPNSKLKRKKGTFKDERHINKKVKVDKEHEGNETLKNNTVAKNGGELKPKKEIVKENLTEQDLIKIEKKKQKSIRQLERRKKKRAELKMQKEERLKNPQQIENLPLKGHETNSFRADELNKKKTSTKMAFSERKIIKKKESKQRDNKEHSRRKPFLPHKMFINGKELEIDYVEGFPVLKADAQRLKKLRKEMISKGLPRSEINIALKLERRRAEKALTREKKKVCFKCRKSGHNLSECPELDKDQVVQTAGTGICFKCGSAEHTHFECKVVRNQEYKFASCFICHEQGHIARQCPDNARGLYPKGGACNECGDVTHLKKDCPKYQAQQQRQEDKLKIETFGNSNPDVLEENSDTQSRRLGNKRVNKVIKF